LRRWLLGLLPQPASHSLEERLLSDAALYEELLIIEDELIDNYLAGGLTPQERKGFESYFMNSPERQEQFRIANALRVYIGDSKKDESTQKVADPPPQESSLAPSKPADPRKGWFQKPIAAIALAAAVLMIVAFVWLSVSLRSSSGNSLSVFLTPGGLTREGGSVQTVILSPDTKFLQIHLRLARKDFQKYRATLVNSEGSVVHTSENLSPSSDTQGPTIQLSIRTEQTPPGEYQLKLDGLASRSFESADSYRFVVIRQ
jgi:hypothetical protein